MSLREVATGEPVQVVPTEKLIAVELYDREGGPVILAGWRVGDRRETRELPPEVLAEVMADPACVALLDKIAEATNSAAFAARAAGAEKPANE